MRISEKEEWFPVQAFFNAVPDDSFVEAVEALVRGVGWSIDACHCEFPADRDLDQAPFRGIRFVVHDEVVLLEHELLPEILERVCRVQKDRRPEQTLSLERALESIHETNR